MEPQFLFSKQGCGLLELKKYPKVVVLVGGVSMAVLKRCFNMVGGGFFLNFFETENKPRRERAGSASEFGKGICKLNPVNSLLPSQRNPIAGF